MTDDEIIDALTDALEIIANGGNAVYIRWNTHRPKTREQMAEIAQSALLAVVSESRK